LHRYPDSGHAQLREAIGKAYNLPAEQILCGAGSDELIGLLTHAYAGQGDEVLFPEHAFLMYKIYTLSNGATPVKAPENNLHADVDALLAKVTARTKIVFLANPNNPTGTYLPFSEIQRLRAGLRPEIILALDAAYAEYMQQDDYNAGHKLVASGNTVVLHTFSKIYGLPALRLGWCYAPANIIDVLNRIRGPFNVNAPALASGLAAVADQAYVKNIVALNAAQRTRVAAALGRLGFTVVPAQANFVLIKCGQKPELSADKINQALLKRGVIVRDVMAYGLPDYLRISIGNAAENDELIKALEAIVANA
jgi:histidinol-phosphate aminotransferase